MNMNEIIEAIKVEFNKVDGKAEFGYAVETTKKDGELLKVIFSVQKLEQGKGTLY